MPLPRNLALVGYGTEKNAVETHHKMLWEGWMYGVGERIGIYAASFVGKGVRHVGMQVWARPWLASFIFSNTESPLKEVIQEAIVLSNSYAAQELLLVELQICGVSLLEAEYLALFNNRFIAQFGSDTLLATLVQRAIKCDLDRAVNMQLQR